MNPGNRMAGSIHSSTATTTAYLPLSPPMSPIPAVGPHSPPNFVPPNTSPEVNFQLEVNLPLMVRFGQDGGSIWIHTESGVVTPAKRKMPPAPPPPKISLETQTGESLLNGEFIRRPNIDVTAGSSRPATGVSPQTSNTFPAGLSKSSNPPAVVPQCSRLPAVAPQCSRPPAVAPQCSRPPAVAPQCSRPPVVVPKCSGLPAIITPSTERNFKTTSSHQSRHPTRNLPVSLSPQSPPPTSHRCTTIAPPDEPLFQNATQLISLIQTCHQCEKSFRSRRHGVDHQRKEHNLRHCPVCFVTISRQGNAFKDHLKLYHALEGDTEMLSCPFCSAAQSFEGLYRHIGWIHLIPVEADLTANQEVAHPAPIPKPHNSNGRQTSSAQEGRNPPQNHTSMRQTSPPNANCKPGQASKTGKISNQIPPSIKNTDPAKVTNRTNSRMVNPALNRIPPRQPDPPSSPQPTNNFRRKSPSPIPPQPKRSKIANPKHSEQELSDKIKAALITAKRRSTMEPSVPRQRRRTGQISDDEMFSTPPPSPQDNRTTGQLKTSQISKLNIIYQQLNSYPDTKIISNKAEEFGVTYAVNWFTKKHMDHCQRVQQSNRKRRRSEPK
ncbi:uncharacterized protein LOC118439514 isoform X2 [Folsomia candida]|uniref:uncharacterized protein LOC118439514 isoform X2 n=1 Tax=Folsomia candida TaxID=158441 RepID=UPI00160522B6|nr:uncharacterized protein LOC118439514 isoform X2 [Folsomia candida]